MPDPALSHVVDHYWRSVAVLQDSLSQQVYTPIMQGMTFNFGLLQEKMVYGSRVQEMSDCCYVFGQPAHHRISLSNPCGIDILGVKFTNLGLYMLTGLSMHILSDDIVPAEAIWGQEIESLCAQMYEAGDTIAMIRLLEGFFYRKLSDQPGCRDTRGVRAAIYAMEHQGIYQINTLLDASFLSQRSMQRHFKEQIGMAPKTYARICRFNRARQFLDQTENPFWPELVHKLGYFDQSHFIRDFRRFAGRSPGAYMEEKAQGTPALF